MAKRPKKPRTKNYLANLHLLTTRFPVLFRERVCIECKWSTPTFYRKTKLQDSISTKTDQVEMVLSNAEMEKIEGIMSEMLIMLNQKQRIYARRHKTVLDTLQKQLDHATA
ncbi:hypothetical protein SAMN05444266_107201 [Chitinophaga jiangningensis]|uniref:Uncharacterized protein n=1 Tax=Chitinophaga jiangningensis TaxID=1419482 RepID=A0A1M7HDZ9_9BACT|nr:hypothetical protein SAMN05444266_107201 [Chitinophaga jiangningensis]